MTTLKPNSPTSCSFNFITTMASNNPNNTRLSHTPSAIITLKRSSTHPQSNIHHSSHRLAIIIAFAIILPLFVFILIEFIKQLSYSPVDYHFLSEDSTLNLQINVTNGDLVSIDFSKAEGIVECILTPSISTTYILNAFNENKKFYGKYYVEYNSYENEEPKQDIKIGEYSPINTLICKHIKRQGNKIEVYKPIEIKSGILYYKQPVAPINLEAKMHGSCIFLSGQKPINQDLLCRAGDRNKSESWEVLWKNQGTGNTVLYLPGTLTQDGYFKPFEIIKCGPWAQIKNLECTSNISIESDLLGPNHESLTSVFLKEEKEIKLNVSQNSNKPITECLIGKGISEDIDNFVLVEDSLLEGAIQCDRVTKESIKEVNGVLGSLNKNEVFKEWDNAKIKQFVSKVKLVINGEGGTGKLEELKVLVHGTKQINK